MKKRKKNEDFYLEYSEIILLMSLLESKVIENEKYSNELEYEGLTNNSFYKILRATYLQYTKIYGKLDSMANKVYFSKN